MPKSSIAKLTPRLLRPARLPEVVVSPHEDALRQLRQSASWSSEARSNTDEQRARRVGRKQLAHGQFTRPTACVLDRVA